MITGTSVVKMIKYTACVRGLKNCSLVTFFVFVMLIVIISCAACTEIRIFNNCNYFNFLDKCYLGDVVKFRPKLTRAVTCKTAVS